MSLVKAINKFLRDLIDYILNLSLNIYICMYTIYNTLIPYIISF